MNGDTDPCLVNGMLLLTEQEKALLKTRIEKIINESDLDTITVKGIRKRIEDEDSRDYSQEKTFFAETITACLEKRLEPEKSNSASEDAHTEQDEDEDFKIALRLQQEEEQQSHRINLRRRASGSARKYQEGIIITPSKNKKPETDGDKPKRSVFNKPLLLSPEMAAVFDNQFTEMSRPDLVKKLWEYIKANNLQDPSDKRFILCDQKLQTVFNRNRINCFKMAKYMSEHVRKIEELSDSTAPIKSSKTTSKSSAKTTSTKSSQSSPKKTKISNEVVEDSDEEADAFLQEELNNNSKAEGPKMNTLLLNVPGVTSDMNYTSVQAAILAYTQVKKLRDPKDNDLIILRPGSPITALMNVKGETSVHLLDLIKRVHFLFDNKDEK